MAFSVTRLAARGSERAAQNTPFESAVKIQYIFRPQELELDTLVRDLFRGWEQSMFGPDARMIPDGATWPVPAPAC